MKKPLLVVSLVLLLCFAFGCQNKAEKAELEKFRTRAKAETQNKELLLRYNEAWNKGDYETLGEIYSSNYSYYIPSANPKPLSGKEQQIAAIKLFKESFPDINVSIEELVALEDTVISRLVMRGTHKGTYQGISATGNKIEVSFMDWIRIRDGKVIEEREEYDGLGLMQQLGMELKPKEVKK